MVARKAKEIWEYGDFQTPAVLAEQVAELIQQLGFRPKSILEPTCGRGTFLLASAMAFPQAKALVGVEIQKEHLTYCRKQITRANYNDKVRLLHEDFFTLNWESILNDLPEPLLIIGNPPWVTSSELGMLGSKNLPEKSNFQGRSGFDALTGKSNFDISEWMLLKHLEWMQTREGMMAVLCKTSVARKVLIQVWKKHQKIAKAWIYKIDAKKHFGAAVDACLFIVHSSIEQNSPQYPVYKSFEAKNPIQIIGYCDEILVADVPLYKRWSHLRGTDSTHIWRSGLKHDCSKVMELKREGGKFRNGFGQKISLEDTYLFPLYKSSDIGNGHLREARKNVIVTQRTVGEDTQQIAQNAPRTWKYLQANKEMFEKRASVIYKNRPPFSIFGVGEYTFAPWKVAISGFYKKLDFKVIEPIQGRTPMVDDTIYFLPCGTKEQAQFLVDLLNSAPARQFLSSMIFWEDKRPITVELLKRLNIKALAKELGRDIELETIENRQTSTSRKGFEQANLLAA